jgi:hypothetical protein
VWRLIPSNTVPRIWVAASPAEATVWFTRSFIITSWFTGIRAIRASNVSNASSSFSSGADSIARPHSFASFPDRQSPVKRSRFVFSIPIR